jgi:hypothetical protein
MQNPVLNLVSDRGLVPGRSGLVYLMLAIAVLVSRAAVAQTDPAAAAPAPVPSEAPSLPSPPTAAIAPPPETARAAPSSGPIIELPPEVPPPAEETRGPLQFGVAPDEEALNRGLAPARMAQSRTVVGGYGQFNLNASKTGASNEYNTQATVRRVVLFVAHPITDDIRVYTEFEWENALACSSCVGSAEIEQAFIHWRLHGDELALRVGLLLVPMGIVNEWHEPPVFNGVERPRVDQLVIPSTWRELGAGFAGNVAQVLRYQLYLTTTLNPLRLGETGLAGGVTQGALAPAKAFAVMGRAEYEPLLGVIGGVSFFATDLGPNADYYRENGSKRSLKLPVYGYALDARMRRWGLEARAVWSQFFLPNSGDLIAAFRADGSPLFPAEATEGTVPKRIQGGYIEAAYNVLSLLHTTHELLPFIRLETYDTQAAVPKGFKRNPALDVNELTVGLTYRPVTQLVFKADLQLRDRRLGYDETQWNLGFGYMF